MDRQDWVLLALNFGGAKGLSPVQLQKSLFLLRMEVQEIQVNFYDFFPHNYGPFCKQIYADAERMAQDGLIVIERMQQSHSIFLISAIGEARVAHIRPEVAPRALNYLRTAVEWTQQQSFSGLIRAIYDKYPEYRINSVFQY
jgi:uncharacterized protein